jgi:hypothetical protein
MLVSNSDNWKFNSCYNIEEYHISINGKCEWEKTKEWFYYRGDCIGMKLTTIEGTSYHLPSVKNQ